MNKKTTLEIQDNIKLADQSNLDPPRKKVELLHEKLFKQYNIDPNKISADRKIQNIPKDWIPNIIETCIELVGIEYSRKEYENSEKIYNIYFENKQIANNFYEAFNSNIFKAINKYIMSLELNPVDYMRSLVFDVVIGEISVHIRF